MLNILKKVFWNAAERRLRALWRLVLQSIALFFLITVFSLFVAALATLTQFLSGHSADFVTMMQNSLGGHPLFILLNSGIQLLAVLGSMALAAWLLDRRSIAAFGLHFNRDWWLDLGFGLGLGALLMAGIFLFELSRGWLTITATWHTRLPVAFPAALLLQMALFLMVGIYEELLMRGYYLRNLAEGLNFPRLGARGSLLLAAVLSSAVFGVAHLGNPHANAVSTLSIALAGIFLGLGYLLTGELAIPIGLHISWNLFQGNVFGFSVSGLASYTSCFAIAQGGPALWTGGEFGPEAGLVGIIAIVLGSALVALWVRWRYGRIALHSSLALYQPLGE
ncbi:MAG TPA: CPBP family intramembrane metalloprotease [Thermoflexia bacterium]|nr:CPBP family intramembrane metalloprotease [Thermoflexia bacterium]